MFGHVCARGGMDQLFRNAGNRLQAAADRKDTTALWRIWSTICEKAFCSHFGTTGSESRNLSGRGSAKIIKFTDAPKLPNTCSPSGSARAAHRKADTFARQQRRLGHVADRAKILCHSKFAKPISVSHQQRFQLLNSQNLSTIEAFVG